MSEILTCSKNVSRRYRREIFDLILKQDMAFFDQEGNASGALASNLSIYPTNLLELLGFNLMLILVNVVNVVSSSILAIAVGWKLGLVVVFGGSFCYRPHCRYVLIMLQPFRLSCFPAISEFA